MGIRYSGEKDGGLKRRCREGGAEAETRGRIERRRPVERNILVDERLKEGNGSNEGGAIYIRRTWART